MKGLKKYKLSELYEMSSGISTKPEQAGHGTPFCSFTTVFNNYFLPHELPDRMDASLEEQETYSLKEGDVLLTRTSETLDELGMSSVAVMDYPAATFSGFLKRLRPRQTNITYHKFLAFYLRSPLFRKAMNNNAVMTLRCSLNEQIFSYLDLLLPDFHQQKKIGDLLYQIYAKIYLNNRINAELEGMAKLLYDYWFVQFDFPMTTAQATGLGKPHLTGHPYRASGGKMIYNEVLKREIPEGWNAGTAESLLIFNPSLSLRDGTEAGFFDMDAVPTCGFMTKAVQRKAFTGGIKFANGDVVVARITPCLENGKTALITQLEDGQVGFGSTEFIVMRGKARSLSAFGACLARSEHFRKFAILNMTGTSGRKRIEAPILKTFPLSIPPIALLSIFEDICEPIFQKMTANEKENQELIQLRDWLLPMLMNGQVTAN